MPEETRTVSRIILADDESAADPKGENLPLHFLLVKEFEAQRRRKDGKWVRASGGHGSVIIGGLDREQLAALIADGANKLATVGNYTVKED